MQALVCYLNALIVRNCFSLGGVIQVLPVLQPLKKTFRALSGVLLIRDAAETQLQLQLALISGACIAIVLDV